MTEPDAGPSTSRTNQHGVTKADFSRWACTEEKRRAAQEEYIDKQNRASLREERAAKWASRGQELAQAGRDRRQTTKQLVSDQLAAARTRAKEVRANTEELTRRKQEASGGFTERAAHRATELVSLEDVRRKLESRAEAKRQEVALLREQERLLAAKATQHLEEEMDARRQQTERVRAEVSADVLRASQRAFFQQRQEQANKTRADEQEWRQMREQHFSQFMSSEAQAVRQGAIDSREGAKRALDARRERNQQAAAQARERRQQNAARLQAQREETLAQKQAMRDAVVSGKFTEDRAWQAAASQLSPERPGTFRFRPRRSQQYQEVRL